MPANRQKNDELGRKMAKDLVVVFQGALYPSHLSTFTLLMFRRNEIWVPLTTEDSKVEHTK
jgi:hypothetical protein